MKRELTGDANDLPRKKVMASREYQRRPALLFCCKRQERSWGSMVFASSKRRPMEEKEFISSKQHSRCPSAVVHMSSRISQKSRTRKMKKLPLGELNTGGICSSRCNWNVFGAATQNYF
jgi:hypothetical protein